MSGRKGDLVAADTGRREDRDDDRIARPRGRSGRSFRIAPEDLFPRLRVLGGYPDDAARRLLRPLPSGGGPGREFLLDHRHEVRMHAQPAQEIGGETKLAARFLNYRPGHFECLRQHVVPLVGLRKICDVHVGGPSERSVRGREPGRRRRHLADGRQGVLAASVSELLAMRLLDNARDQLPVGNEQSVPDVFRASRIRVA